MLQNPRAAGHWKDIVLVLGFASLWACDEPSSIPLATIERVDPPTVEPGDIIAIRGTGFVEGPAEVKLDGEFKPIRVAAAKHMTIVLEGTAISGFVIEVPVTPGAMRGLADEPTRFRGKVDVNFPSIEPMGFVKVAARKSDVTLDLTPAGGSVPLAANRSREAARFLLEQGLRLSQDDELVVAEVISGSPAARAGLHADDRLLAANGIALKRSTDLTDMQQIPHLRLEVVSAQGIMREVELSSLRKTPFSRDEFAAIVFSAVTLGLFLAFVAPSAERRDPLAAVPRHPLAGIVGYGAASILILLFPVMAIYLNGGFGFFVAMFGISAFGLSVVSIAAKGGALKRLVVLFVRLAPIPLLLSVTSICGSTIALADLVASQQSAPWRWHVWSNPFVLIAMVCGLSLIWPPANVKNPKISDVVSIAAWLAAMPAAMAICSCCLGGWLVPGVSVDALKGNGWLIAAGCALFFAKTWTALWVARWFASVGYVERRTHEAESGLGLRFCVLVLASILALFWSTAGIPDTFLTTGQVLSTAGFAAFLTVFAVLSLKRTPFGAAIALIARGRGS